MVGAIVLSPTDAASQEAVVGSAQRILVARGRAPRDAAVQHCLECLGSEHPDFELEGNAWSVVQLEGIRPEAVPCVASVPIDLDGEVGAVIGVPPCRSYDYDSITVSPAWELTSVSVHYSQGDGVHTSLS